MQPQQSAMLPACCGFAAPFCRAHGCARAGSAYRLQCKSVLLLRSKRSGVFQTVQRRSTFGFDAQNRPSVIIQAISRGVQRMTIAVAGGV